MLKYLKGSVNPGISIFESEKDSRLHGFVSWLSGPKPSHMRALDLTDSNWSPQDASRPSPAGTETRTVEIEECKSLQGGILMCCGGPVWWNLQREKRCSGSSCEGEIKSIDMTYKETLHLGYLMEELELPDARGTTPVYNDNMGTVNWSETGVITKNLRHFNMKEVSIRDAQASGEIKIMHIPGKTNPSDKGAPRPRTFPCPLRCPCPYVTGQCRSHGGCWKCSGSHGRNPEYDRE